MQDRNYEVSAGHRGELRLQVHRELGQLLESVAEMDLGTVYRTIVALVGVHAVPDIAEVISAGLRAGEIELEASIPGPDGAVVAFIRRAACRQVAA